MGVAGRGRDSSGFAAIAGGARFEPDPAGEVELKAPLGWFGHLRGEPARLPLVFRDAGCIRMRRRRREFKNSTMPDFLQSVGPQMAIISAGEQNPYGHPSPELLERLRGSEARILRTGEEGAVRVVTDGHKIRVSCFVGCGVGEERSWASGAR
jgi:hypothetical protein